ncbi:MAG TPA: autoinducer binding domain-containing protein [Candidatus Limnocylindria bacterium]|nr:autoinducer binding domain-containing protein [Candidatus Limnocylindria bacterium]
MKPSDVLVPSQAFRVELAACRELQDLFKPLRRACTEFRFDHYNIMYRSPIFNRQARFFTLTSFPEKVHRAYEDGDYLEVDPVLLRSAMTHRPICWHDVDWNLTDERRALWHIYRDAGLEFGISIPVPGPSNRFALITLAGRHCPVHGEEIPALVDRVRTLAHLVFDQLVEMPELKQSNGEVSRLTEREVEFLRLSALGYPLKKIHELMDIKQSTATYFTNKIVSKLGARRLRMAIIQAQLNGMIDLIGFPSRIVGTDGWFHEESTGEKKKRKAEPEPACRYLPPGEPPKTT